MTAWAQRGLRGGKKCLLTAQGSEEVSGAEQSSQGVIPEVGSPAFPPRRRTCSGFGVAGIKGRRSS